MTADPLREALEQIAHLCDGMANAYPESIFPPPPEELRAKDGIAADVLREIASPQFAAAADIARAALAALPAPEPDGFGEGHDRSCRFYQSFGDLPCTCAASVPEGVVVLNGQRFSVEADGIMSGDYARAWLLPLADTPHEEGECRE